MIVDNEDYNPQIINNTQNSNLNDSWFVEKIDSPLNSMKVGNYGMNDS